MSDQKKLIALEGTRSRIRQILQEAKDWETERVLGPLSVYVPGDVTIEYVKTIAEWVKPKDATVASVLLSTGKSLPAALAIMIGTPAGLLEDSVLSVINVTRRLIGAAPPGAYLPPGKESILLNELDKLNLEIVQLRNELETEHNDADAGSLLGDESEDALYPTSLPDDVVDSADAWEDALYPMSLPDNGSVSEDASYPTSLPEGDVAPADALGEASYPISRPSVGASNDSNDEQLPDSDETANEEHLPDQEEITLEEQLPDSEEFAIGGQIPHSTHTEASEAPTERESGGDQEVRANPQQGDQT